MRNPGVWIAGGIAGALSIICYLVAITVSWPENQLGTSVSLLVGSGFPILGIIYGYGIHSYVAAERDGAANHLGLAFIIAAFATLLAMLLVQHAVTTGVGAFTGELDAPTARAIRRSLRLVDLGLDVAWDLLGGVALVFWGVAISRRSGLGPGWGVPLAALGAALVVLNAATFPTPPANGGLIDIGPFVGIFMFALGVRLALLGKRALRQPVGPS